MESERGVKRNTSKTKSENNKAKIGTTSSKRKASENGIKFGAELNIEKETKRLKLVQPKIELYFGSKCKKNSGWRGSFERGETDQS